MIFLTPYTNHMIQFKNLVVCSLTYFRILFEHIFSLPSELVLLNNFPVNDSLKNSLKKPNNYKVDRQQTYWIMKMHKPKEIDSLLKSMENFPAWQYRDLKHLEVIRKTKNIDRYKLMNLISIHELKTMLSFITAGLKEEFLAHSLYHLKIISKI